jgi:hypothetical protein
MCIPIIVTEFEFCSIGMQVLDGAVLIDARCAALENAEVAVSRVRVNRAASASARIPQSPF